MSWCWRWSNGNSWLGWTQVTWIISKDNLVYYISILITYISLFRLTYTPAAAAVLYIRRCILNESSWMEKKVTTQSIERYTTCTRRRLLQISYVITSPKKKRENMWSWKELTGSLTLLYISTSSSFTVSLHIYYVKPELTAVFKYFEWVRLTFLPSLYISYTATQEGFFLSH